VAVAKQLVVTLENRPGSLAQLCSELAKVAVNIQAIQASEGNPATPVRLLVSQMDAAKKVCERLGLKYNEESVLAILVGNRPGALGRITRKLADAGVNIDYLYGTIEKDTRQALIVCGVSDIEAAKRAVP
jgi:hypothetical protein